VDVDVVRGVWMVVVCGVFRCVLSAPWPDMFGLLLHVGSENTASCVMNRLLQIEITIEFETQFE
jgi:hypothetical protein